MRIWISNRQRKVIINQASLKRKAAKILNALGWSKGDLSLTLVSDRAMARLNRETFGRSGPTNVIAFPLDAPGGPANVPASIGPAGRGPGGAGPAPVLGEVVISVETTRRQAAETGWRWQELLDFFLIHGILHLLGYDHEAPESERRMTEKAWELLRLLYPKSLWVGERPAG
jgi:probable rRNA maturation factor